MNFHDPPGPEDASAGFEAGDVSTFAINSSTSYENYYAELLFSSGSAYLAEFQLFVGTLQNMTLVSNSFTADSAPSNTVIGVQIVENESITIKSNENHLRERPFIGESHHKHLHNGHVFTHLGSRRQATSIGKR